MGAEEPPHATDFPFLSHTHNFFHSLSPNEMDPKGSQLDPEAPLLGPDAAHSLSASIPPQSRRPGAGFF